MYLWHLQYKFALPGLLGIFSELCQIYHVKNCTDPRDRVYGLLGIANEDFRGQIKPDYSSSVAKVYREAVVAEVGTSYRLDILSQCNIQYRSLEEGASWIPDWAKTIPAGTPSVPPSAVVPQSRPSKSMVPTVSNARGLHTTLSAMSEKAFHL
ncbi:hypothetical protein BDV96DRAFT_308187 [Lophiotrema nucula]|uniref:Uncharacterized protein n=1 Tax=Lophiotrema nucula TaxID=690887 RepID=A0A6A5YLM2_9PLEO|nr:hypothetical protein BDV96DRAFT_308187 [Lophiotrema nucula]